MPVPGGDSGGIQSTRSRSGKLILKLVAWEVASALDVIVPVLVIWSFPSPLSMARVVALVVMLASARGSSLKIDRMPEGYPSALTATPTE